MEIFKGYVSFGFHMASEGIPRIPRIREGFVRTFQMGARNIYYAESARVDLETVENEKICYMSQPLETRSILLAGAQARGRDDIEYYDLLRKELANYRSSLDSIGPARTKRYTLARDPDLEIWALFGVAEEEMVDALPRNLAIEYDAEGLSQKDLARSDYLIDQYEKALGAIPNVIKAGNVSSGLGLARRAARGVGESLRFRNPRIVKNWCQYREQAVYNSVPTRIASRFGLAHVGLKNGLSMDEWTFEEDIDLSLHPFSKLGAMCEADPKKFPTDDECCEMLLGQVVNIRLEKLDVTYSDALVFSNKLLQQCTPLEIKQLIKSLSKGFNARFDGFVTERGLALPGLPI